MATKKPIRIRKTASKVAGAKAFDEITGDRIVTPSQAHAAANKGNARLAAAGKLLPFEQDSGPSARETLTSAANGASENLPAMENDKGFLPASGPNPHALPYFPYMNAEAHNYRERIDEEVRREMGPGPLVFKPVNGVTDDRNGARGLIDNTSHANTKFGGATVNDGTYTLDPAQESSVGQSLREQLLSGNFSRTASAPAASRDPSVPFTEQLGLGDAPLQQGDFQTPPDPDQDYAARIMNMVKPTGLRPLEDFQSAVSAADPREQVGRWSITSLNDIERARTKLSNLERRTSRNGPTATAFLKRGLVKPEAMVQGDPVLARQHAQARELFDAQNNQFVMNNTATSKALMVGLEGLAALTSAQGDRLTGEALKDGAGNAIKLSDAETKRNMDTVMGNMAVSFIEASNLTKIAGINAKAEGAHMKLLAKAYGSPNDPNAAVNVANVLSQEMELLNSPALRSNREQNVFKVEGDLKGFLDHMKDVGQGELGDAVANATDPVMKAIFSNRLFLNLVSGAKNRGDDPLSNAQAIAGIESLLGTSPMAKTIIKSIATDMTMAFAAEKGGEEALINAVGDGSHARTLGNVVSERDALNKEVKVLRAESAQRKREDEEAAKNAGKLIAPPDPNVLDPRRSVPQT